MALKPKGDKCKLEVYGPDEEGVRIICNSITDCPLEHPGEIGLDCFGPIVIKNLDFTKGGSVQIGDLVIGAGSAVPEAGVQPPGPPESAGSRPEASERSPLPQNRTTPGTPEVEPDSHMVHGDNYLGDIPALCPRCHSEGSLGEDHICCKCGYVFPDSHMVVEKDARREEMVQKYVDKLNEISMEMYLESKSSGPPPIPILGPKESEEFLRKLDEFTLTPEQQEFYRDARRRFPPEWHPDEPGFSSLSHWEPEVYDAMKRRQNRRLKRKKRYTVRKSGGMIRMPGNKPEPPEPEEESLFEVDEKDYGPVLPNVKAEPELQKPVPKVERPEEPEEPEEDETEDADEAPEQVIEGFETSGDTSLGGYFLGLEVWTDDDGDHTVTLTIDAMSYDIMLPDFMEMLGALNKVKGRLQQILNT
jgi:hypothetical protein